MQHNKSSFPRSKSQTRLLTIAVLLLLFSIGGAALAGSATWNLSPTNGDWTNAANWTPATVPNGPSDTATFQSSNTTSVTLFGTIEVNGIVFNSGASAFTLNPTFGSNLAISGTGVANSSGITQSFVTAGNATDAGFVTFSNSATAGNLSSYTNNGGTVSGAGGGQTNFNNASTAGSASIANNPGQVSGAGGGLTDFVDTSTAASAAITNNAVAVSGANPDATQFFATSTAGSATIVNNGSSINGAFGGLTSFFDSTSAGSATFTNNGGTNGGLGGSTRFFASASGGTARLIANGNGSLDISSLTTTGMGIGSIEGSGNFFLGSKALTVGGNNLSTTVSGVIQDGGRAGGVGGSLTKTGNGALTLSKANTYTGSTTISVGTLLLRNTSGSGTGLGAVRVSAGTLGGTGKIAGTVTMGTGSGTGAFLSPGTNANFPGTLSIQKKLTFKADSTYTYGLKSTNATADKVVAKGVTINSGALFSFVDIGGGVLTLNTVFTAINNTSATPIAGTFSNLPDNSTFTGGSNNFQASYEGGTGNDLTLTVVP